MCTWVVVQDVCISLLSVVFQNIFYCVCSFSVFVVSPQGKMLTDCFKTGNVHVYSF